MIDLPEGETAPSPALTGLRFPDAETVLKLATAALGVLYVLGIMVSNIQLIGLGIADFSGLQARNILTGFLFTCFAAGLFFILLPLTLVTFLCQKQIVRSRSRLIDHACTVVICLVATLFSASAVGTFIQHLYPWGLPYDSTYLSQLSLFTRQAWVNSASFMVFSYDQLLEMYGHLKTIIASLFILVGANCFFYIRGLVREIGWEELPAVIIYYAAGAFAFVGVGVFGLLLFGYADDVYPNLLYNLGGGQPQIAEVSLTDADVAIADWLGASGRSSATKSGVAFKTNAVAVWYQSDKFLYMSPLVEGNTAQVYAVDVKLVQGMRYLADASVRISSGDRIRKVYAVNPH